VSTGFDTNSARATHREPSDLVPSPLDLAIDQAMAAVSRKLRDVLTTTRFGVVTVEVRNGQVFVGGGATVRIENG